MSVGRWRRGVAALALLGSLAVASCTPVRNPATGETQYTSMTPSDEAAIGLQQHPKVLAEYGGAYKDQRVQAYVTRVGERVKAVSELSGQRFTFTVLDSDIVNAFALPGGFIYISRGLLALADNEAELAGVLGHAIGHVTARHAAQQKDRATAAGVGATILTVAGSLLFGDTGAQLGQAAAGAGATWFVQGYSQEQEFQGDELGIRYLTRAGYDPRAMASFLAKLEADGRLRARLAGREAREADWTSSHPSAPDRVARATREAGAAKGGKIDRDVYLAAIDGVAWGDSPDQGLVRGRAFVHPALDLRFEVPSGFKIQNGAQAVAAQSTDGRIIVFDIERTRNSGDPAAYITGEWLAKGRPEQVRESSVGGRRAATAFAPVSFRGKPAVAQFAAIENGQGSVYRFVMLRAGRELSRGDVAEFEAMLASFHRLNAADRASAQPLRIDVYTVRPGDTIDGIAGRMPVDNAREQLVLLNGLERRVLQPGEKIKIIVAARPGTV